MKRISTYILFSSLFLFLVGLASAKINSSGVDNAPSALNATSLEAEMHLFDNDELIELNRLVHQRYPYVVVTSVDIELVDDAYVFNYKYTNDSGDELLSNDSALLVHDVIFGLKHGKLDPSVITKIIRGSPEGNNLKKK